MCVCCHPIHSLDDSLVYTYNTFRHIFAYPSRGPHTEGKPPTRCFLSAIILRFLP